MEYKRLHIFEITQERLVIISDPCFITREDLNVGAAFEHNTQGIVTLIDNDNIMMLSIDTPDNLNIVYVEPLGHVPVDAGALCMIHEDIVNEYRDKPIEDIFKDDDTNRAVRYPTKQGDGQYPAFVCFDQNTIVALCVWRGQPFGQRADELYVLNLFNTKTNNRSD